jgi:hypothetical protein
MIQNEKKEFLKNEISTWSVVPSKLKLVEFPGGLLNQSKETTIHPFHPL